MALGLVGVETDPDAVLAGAGWPATHGQVAALGCISDQGLDDGHDGVGIVTNHAHREVALLERVGVVLTGPGYQGAYAGPIWEGEGSVSSAMAESQLLVTSGGRTVYEAATMGIPTLVIAQNLREVTHVHLGAEHGNVYLGLADLVSGRDIAKAVYGLMRFPEPRVEMSARSRMQMDGKGLRRVVRLIEDLMEGL